MGRPRQSSTPAACNPRDMGTGPGPRPSPSAAQSPAVAKAHTVRGRSTGAPQAGVPRERGLQCCWGLFHSTPPPHPRLGIGWWVYTCGPHPVTRIVRQHWPSASASASGGGGGGDPSVRHHYVAHSHPKLDGLALVASPHGRADGQHALCGTVQLAPCHDVPLARCAAVLQAHCHAVQALRHNAQLAHCYAVQRALCDTLQRAQCHTVLLALGGTVLLAHCDVGQHAPCDTVQRGGAGAGGKRLGGGGGAAEGGRGSQRARGAEDWRGRGVRSLSYGVRSSLFFLATLASRVKRGRSEARMRNTSGTAIHSNPPRDASEPKGPQRRPQRRLDGRLEEVAKAVGGRFCRLPMLRKPALGVRDRVSGHGRGGGGATPTPPNAMDGPHQCHAPRPKEACMYSPSSPNDAPGQAQGCSGLVRGRRAHPPPTPNAGPGPPGASRAGPSTKAPPSRGAPGKTSARAHIRRPVHRRVTAAAPAAEGP